MKVLIIGCGLVGRELARQLKADGHHVAGTTTTAGKVADITGGGDPSIPPSIRPFQRVTPTSSMRRPDHGE